MQSYQEEFEKIVAPLAVVTEGADVDEVFANACAEFHRLEEGYLSFEELRFALRVDDAQLMKWVENDPSFPTMDTDPFDRGMFLGSEVLKWAAERTRSRPKGKFRPRWRRLALTL